jgi:hypothetical protein
MSRVRTRRTGIVTVTGFTRRVTRNRGFGTFLKERVDGNSFEEVPIFAYLIGVRIQEARVIPFGSEEISIPTIAVVLTLSIEDIRGLGDG